MALPGLKNSINRHSVKKPSLSRAGGGSHRADGKGLKFKAAGAMTNTARSGIFSSRHAGSRGNFVYASSSSKLAKYGLHINRNGKISNKPNFSALRLALNGRSGGYSNNIRYVTPSYTTGNCSNCSGNSFMNTLSGIQQLMMMSQMLGLDNEKKTEGNEKKKTDGSGGSSGTGDAGTTTPTKTTAAANSWSKDISNAKDFSTLSSIESGISNNKSALTDNYTSGAGNILDTSGDGVSDGIGLLTGGKELLDNSFKLEDFTDDNKNDYDKIETKIDKDIESVKTYKDQIKTCSKQIPGKLSELRKELNTQESILQKDSSNSTAENKKDELKKQIKQLEAAQTALANAENSCDDLENTLETKKKTCKKLKKAEDDLKDGKYKLAEDKDKELGNLVKKYNKLSSSTKEKDKTECESLKKEISTLYNELTGQTDIKNSKGETYSFQNINNAKKIADDNSSQNTGGGNSTVNEDIYDYIGNLSYPDGSSLA